MEQVSKTFLIFAAATPYAGVGDKRGSTKLRPSVNLENLRVYRTEAERRSS